MPIATANTSPTATEPGIDQMPDSEAVWAERRQHKRQTVVWPARCRFNDNEWEVTIIDASNGGFGLDRRLPIAPGTNLLITIDQVGQFDCRIAWASDARCGLELLHENGGLSAEQMNGLSSALSTAKNNNSQTLSETQLDEIDTFLKR